VHRARRTLLIALSGAVVVGLAACSGGSSNGADESSGGSASGGGSGQGSGGTGGTLYYLTNSPASHLDPQRTYTFRGLANETRLMYRTLTTFPAASGAAATKIAPDLAVGTGKPSKDSKTWRFTLKDGIRWQDGKPITCQDFQYGISRTFATDVITGGPTYAIQYLDIPKNADGSSKYPGPYDADAQQQKLFDRAVQCDGRTITFHLGKSVPDFNYAVYLPAFGPYREDKDHGDKSNFSVFSNGPYKLEGTWDQGNGGTFVRNPEWDRSTDAVRKARPDEIVIREGIEQEVVAQRLIADQGDDKDAITEISMPPQFVPKVMTNSDLKARTETPAGAGVDHLKVNFTSPTMQNKAVRKALLVATDKGGYVTALGGSQLDVPAYSIINPALKGYRKINPYHTKVSGDPARAKQILEDAGVSLPVKITYLFQNTGSTAQKAAAALKNTWDKAGFRVALHGESDNFYSLVADPSYNTEWDISWDTWGADWPNPSTVIPPLFDSRVNLTKGTNGKDSGRYSSRAVNELIDQSYQAPTPEQQAEVLQQADLVLQKDIAYIPLAVGKYVFTRGSDVTDMVYNPSLFAYPDLASVGVEQ
jgi:peptide/nickel transport system substrate-binding protein